MYRYVVCIQFAYILVVDVDNVVGRRQCHRSQNQYYNHHDFPEEELSPIIL